MTLQQQNFMNLTNKLGLIQTDGLLARGCCVALPGAKSSNPGYIRVTLSDIATRTVLKTFFEHTEIIAEVHTAQNIALAVALRYAHENSLQTAIFTPEKTSINWYGSLLTNMEYSYCVNSDTPRATSQLRKAESYIRNTKPLYEVFPWDKKWNAQFKNLGKVFV